jgi:hypothetical protein
MACVSLCAVPRQIPATTRAQRRRTQGMQTQGMVRCPRLAITFWQRLLQEEDDQQHAAGLTDEANQEGVVVHREAWLIARVAIAGEVDQVDERPENLQLSRLSRLGQLSRLSQSVHHAMQTTTTHLGVGAQAGSQSGGVARRVSIALACPSSPVPMRTPP